MPKFDTGLTDAERERLAILVEEAGEVIHIAMKILRHGYFSFHPDNPYEDNRALLENELGHLDCAICRLVDEGDVDDEAIIDSSMEKEQTINKYLHYQNEVENGETDTVA